MTEADLKQCVRRHNTLQVVGGMAMLLGAIVLWPISFWILRLIADAPLQLMGIRDAGNLTLYVALGGMLILVLEGVRYWKLLRAEREDCVDDEFRDSMRDAAVAGRGFGAHRVYVFEGYLAAHFILVAPRMNARAFHMLHQWIITTPAALEQGTRAYNQLAELRKWVPVSAYPDCGAGIFLLDRLRLIWTRLENGELQLRTPPGSKPGKV